MKGNKVLKERLLIIKEFLFHLVEIIVKILKHTRRGGGRCPP